MRWLVLAILPLLAVTAGCTAARSAAGGGAGEKNLTLGSVQRAVKIGMSGAEVIEAFGSPNLVTTDSERREVWAYDRVYTEKAESRIEGGIWALVLSGVWPAGGGISGEETVSRTSQGSLTVVVEFDEQGRVRDFAYQSYRY